MKRIIDLEFITPMFSHGATDQPEIRSASIRGQLHAWFRILGGDIEAERRVFGGIKQRNADSGIMPSHEKTLASRVVVRVSDVNGGARELPTLPHKQGGMAAPRKAYDVGTKCRIMITDRLGGLIGADEALLNRAINAWLLMGTLGFRSTRAAGSFAWVDESFPMPTDPTAYQAACRDLLREASAQAKVAVLERDTPYSSAELARRAVSDSLGGPGENKKSERDDLQDLNNPLGCIKGKSRIGEELTRKTSPLKYRILRFGNQFRILAFWDGRTDVTGNTNNDLYNVIDLLAQRKPEIGAQLKKAFE